LFYRFFLRWWISMSGTVESQLLNYRTKNKHRLVEITFYRFFVLNGNFLEHINIIFLKQWTIKIFALKIFKISRKKSEKISKKILRIPRTSKAELWSRKGLKNFPKKTFFKQIFQPFSYPNINVKKVFYKISQIFQKPGKWSLPKKSS